jgi:hypothetical protein
MTHNGQGVTWWPKAWSKRLLEHWLIVLASMLITYKVKIYELALVLFNYHVGVQVNISNIILWFSLGGHPFMVDN